MWWSIREPRARLPREPSDAPSDPPTAVLSFDEWCEACGNCMKPIGSHTSTEARICLRAVTSTLLPGKRTWV